MGYEVRSSKSKEHWLRMKKDALRRHASGECLTLEETAAAIWNPKTEAHPMTCMGVLKIEKKALSKLKAQLSKYGIKDLSDVVEPKFRENGKPTTSTDSI